MTGLEWGVVIAPVIAFPVVALATVAVARFFVYRHAERTAREIASAYARKEIHR